MFDKLKIKYCFKNRKTGEIIETVLTINQIEIQGINPNPFRSFDWTMLSREIVEKGENNEQTGKY